MFFLILKQGNRLKSVTFSLEIVKECDFSFFTDS